MKRARSTNWRLSSELRWALVVVLVTVYLGHQSPLAAQAVGDFREEFVLSHGDLILPRISPDATFIAYVNVVRNEDRESSELWLLERETRARRLLLSSEDALSHASDGAIASSLRWASDDQLVFGLSDGDVDLTEFTFLAPSGELFGDTLVQGGIGPLGPRQLALVSRLSELRPEWPQLLLSHVARQSVWVGPNVAVFQKRYAGEDHHIWQVDLTSGAISTIHSLGDGPENWARDSQPLAGGVAFLLGRAPRVVLMYVHSGHVVGEVSLAARRGAGSLEVVGEGDGWGVLLARVVPKSEPGSNLLFNVQPDGLIEWDESIGLFDASMSSDRRVLTISRWAGERRVLDVRTREGI